MCFLNAIEIFILHDHNEVLSIKSMSRLISSDIENNKEFYKTFHTGIAEE